MRTLIGASPTRSASSPERSEWTRQQVRAGARHRPTQRNRANASTRGGAASPLVLPVWRPIGFFDDEHRLAAHGTTCGAALRRALLGDAASSVSVLGLLSPGLPASDVWGWSGGTGECGDAAVGADQQEPERR
jgi:hypothetical protein